MTHRKAVVPRARVSVSVCLSVCLREGDLFKQIGKLLRITIIDKGGSGMRVGGWG